MQRYFFHLRCGEKILQDCDGMMLSGPEAACQEAKLTVLDFVQPSTGQVAPDWEGWSIEVRDERGRCTFFAPFAAKSGEVAAEITEHGQSADVVSLDFVRAKREFASVEKQNHELVRRASMLADQNRYEAKNLLYLLQTAQEVRLRSAEVVARSRQQAAWGDWSSPHAEGGTKYAGGSM
jgi:hypothetical protein